jgi:aarF domain-containing kinase
MFSRVRNALGVGVIAGAGGLAVKYKGEDDEWADYLLHVPVAAARFSVALATCGAIVTDYFLLPVEDGSASWRSARDTTHQRSADRLLRLARFNGGLFIKAGQHLAALDHILPPQFTTTLANLQDSSPPGALAAVRETILKDLGAYPENLFDSFDPTPVAAASLAQVHRAVAKDGTQLAVKVQYAGLRGMCHRDLATIDVMTSIVMTVFPKFKLGWLASELRINLTKELDFVEEGRNNERFARDVKAGFEGAVAVPEVVWPLTSGRVLTMTFEEGVKISDVDGIKGLGLNPSEVGTLLNRLFLFQIFQSGFVHADPHAGNLLVRKSRRGGKPEIVVLDHGLYRELSRDAVVAYASLWEAILSRDEQKVKVACEAVGIRDHKVFSVMLTARSWDAAMKNITGAPDRAERKMLGDLARDGLIDITEVMESMPREHVLLFKTNDLLRNILRTLKTSPVSTLSALANQVHTVLHGSSWWSKAWFHLTLWCKMLWVL